MLPPILSQHARPPDQTLYSSPAAGFRLQTTERRQGLEFKQERQARIGPPLSGVLHLILADIFNVSAALGLLQPPGPFRGDRLSDTALLELCDAVRMSIVEERSLGAKAEEITLFLKAVVKDESGSLPALEFATVQYARLDKLLSDIANLANRQATLYHQSRIDPSLSERLQRFWVARFRERYFNLDQLRYQTLAKTGRLRDVVFDETSGTDWQFWKAGSYRILSEVEGNRQFEPGHWWLNLACAHRDGIVGSIYESPTKGKYGVAALPLMTGREEICTTAGTVRYMREAKLSGTHVALISQVGFQIRILRGHGLRSPLAPKAGIRYDGLYKISQYGVKKIPQSSLYRVVLTFERIAGQRPLHELIKIPRPSHLDDWQLFERYEGEMVRQKYGEQLFLDWKMVKAQERMDQRQWRRALKVGATLALRKASKNSRSTTQDYDRDHDRQIHDRDEDLDLLVGDVNLRA